MKKTKGGLFYETPCIYQAMN